MFKIGRKIVEARQEKNLTQKQLAEILQVPRNTLSRWENDINEPSVEMIRNISIALETEPNFFFGFGD